jgi:hypothetical protein
LKANQTSVATALQRKANKQDVENMIANKCDITDLDKICAIIDRKAEQSYAEDIASRTASVMQYNKVSNS